MQCSACRAVYSNGLDTCSRCQAPLPQQSSTSIAAQNSYAASVKTAQPQQQQRQQQSPESSSAGAARSSSPPAPLSSTLVEFPRGNRTANYPPWRKDLSERVRQIQERRAREAAREAEEAELRRSAQPIFVEPPPPPVIVAEEMPPAVEIDVVDEGEARAHPLGLVPTPDSPPLNPLVAAALKRIERARQPMIPIPRPRGGGAVAAAVARYDDEQQYAPEVTPPVGLPSVASPEMGQAQDLSATHSASTPPAETSAASANPASPAPRPSHNLTIVTPKSESTSNAGKTESSLDAAPQQPRRDAETAASVAPTATAAAAPSPMPKQTTIVTPKAGGTAVTVQASAAERASKNGIAVDTVTSAASAEVKAPAATRTPRKVFEGVVDDAMLARREAEKSTTSSAATHSASAEKPLLENFDDRAPLTSRFVGNLIDLVVIAFIASPFAAVIELTNGNWSDPRVIASTAGVVLVVSFLYLCVSTLLAGRTWGMSIVSVHPADVETGMAPTTKQAIVRAFGYLMSLAALGLGLLYALFDAEGRTLHDHVSGTVVLRD